jgi:hypothetical protein
MELVKSVYDWRDLKFRLGFELQFKDSFEIVLVFGGVSIVFDRV